MSVIDYRRPVEIWLWETAAGPYRDLVAEFPQAHISDTTAHPHDPAIHNADFVFIDPSDKSHWTSISKLVRCLDPKRSVLVWLPLGADTTKKPPIEDRKSLECRDEALNLGMRVSTIRWARGGRPIGCQLLYRVNANAQSAIRSAVDAIIHVAQVRNGNSTKWGYFAVHH